MKVPVTVVSCVYGEYQRFIPGWEAAVRALDPAPEAVIVATGGNPRWKHPQAQYLLEAFLRVETEWTWIHDIDDLAFPDALQGIDEVAADVWQMGFENSEGERYVVPHLTNEEFLALDQCPYVAGSAIRTDSFFAAGGFQDIAFQDWGLWRRVALAGMNFQTSGRTHFRYMRHPKTRSVTELTPDRRAANIAEMMETENVAA